MRPSLAVFNSRRHVIGALLLALGTVLLIFAALLFYLFRVNRPTFSPYTVLTASWEYYKQRHIDNTGRVIDFVDQGDLTTSEGQSYAMLRAVWIDDQTTFDQVWNWTQNNLKRPNDALFGWRWELNDSGQGGFSPDGGENSASDADQDIALALILASRRWANDEYLNQARPILADTWQINTASVSGQRYLTAGNWAISEEAIILNPSYFPPYAWRIFAQVDPERDWESLIDPAYDVLNKSAELPLNTNESSGLPPNWIALNPQSGELSAPNSDLLTTHYSYDAVRIPWRIALDHFWFKESRAEAYLNTAFAGLLEEYRQNNRLVSEYRHNGEPLTDHESPTMYATFLSLLQVISPEEADQLYQNKILTLYSNDENGFLSTIPYYEQNWLWFASALYLDQLSNFEGIRS